MIDRIRQALRQLFWVLLVMAMVQRSRTSPGSDLLSTPGSAASQGPGLRNAIPSLRICEARARLGLTFSECFKFSYKKLSVKNGIQEHEK